MAWKIINSHPPSPTLRYDCSGKAECEIRPDPEEVEEQAILLVGTSECDWKMTCDIAALMKLSTVGLGLGVWI